MYNLVLLSLLEHTEWYINIGMNKVALRVAKFVYFA